MVSPLQFDAVIDPARNLVRTRFAGDFTGAAMQGVASQIATLLQQTKPGFSIFADFGQVTAMDLDSVGPLTQIMDLCRAHGVSLIVRILPDKANDIGINLLSIVHYRGKVKIVTVSTSLEAERVLL